MGHISGVGAFFIIVIIVAIIGGISWLVYTHLRARRLGLPQPTLSSYNPFANRQQGGNYGGNGGSGGGFMGKMKAMFTKNNRSTTGGYEEPLSSNLRGRSNRGFGPLDPDEAWDARVGTEADAYGPGGYYEEQELGLHGVGPAPGLAAADTGRGRSLSRDPEPYIGGSQAGLDRRYDEEMGRKPAQNPFGDEAEASNVSLRGVSPRPMESGIKSHRTKDSLDDGASERRSIFRENI